MRYTDSIAFCQQCHRPFLIGEEGEAYTCFGCMADLMGEPPKLEWEPTEEDIATDA